MTKQNKGRKLFAVSASAALVASAIVPVASANADFTDASSISEYAQTAVEYFVGQEVINGYEDGSFKPKASVKRGEAAKMFTTGLGLDTDVESDLTDIAGHWAEEFINAVAAEGIVNGYEDGSFQPEKTLTRAETAKMIVEALQIEEEGDISDFTDVAGHWSEDYIVAAVGAGVLTGKTTTTMDPDGPVTREQFAAMLYRAFDYAGLIEGEEDEVAAALAALAQAKADLEEFGEITEENYEEAQALLDALNDAIAALEELDLEDNEEALEALEEAQTLADETAATIEELTGEDEPTLEEQLAAAKADLVAAATAAAAITTVDASNVEAAQEALDTLNAALEALNTLVEENEIELDEEQAAQLATAEALAAALAAKVEAAQETPPTEDTVKVESVNAVNATTIQVTFSGDITADQAKLENYALSAGQLEAVTVTGKVATLKVKGLTFGQELTVNVVNPANSATVKVPEVSELYVLDIATDAASDTIKSDGAAKTVVTVTLKDKTTGEVVDKDGVIQFQATNGGLGQTTSALVDGKASVQLTSEASPVSITSIVTATVQNVLGEGGEAFKGIAGQKSVIFSPNADTSEVAQFVQVVSAESTAGDRLFVQFSAPITAANYKAAINATTWNKTTNYSGIMIDGKYVNVKDVRQATTNTLEFILDTDLPTSAAFGNPGTHTRIEAGWGGVTATGKNYLRDNVQHNVSFPQNVGKLVLASTTGVNFILTDTSKPAVLGVTAKDQIEFTVRFTEAVDERTVEEANGQVARNFLIDGKQVVVNDDPSAGDIATAKAANRVIVTSLQVGAYSATSDDRNKVTFKMHPEFALGGGQHVIQVANVTDWSGDVDPVQNTVVTDTFSFNVTVDNSIPKAEIEVQSPEQWLVKYDKPVLSTTNKVAADVIKVKTGNSADAELVYGVDFKVFITDASGVAGRELAATDRIAAGSQNFLIEFTQDWSRKYDTKTNTTKTYFAGAQNPYTVTLENVRSLVGNVAQKQELKVTLAYDGASPTITSAQDVFLAEDKKYVTNVLSNANAATKSAEVKASGQKILVNFSEPVKVNSDGLYPAEGLTASQDQFLNSGLGLVTTDNELIAGADTTGAIADHQKAVQASTYEFVKGDKVVKAKVAADSVAANDKSFVLEPEEQLEAGEWTLYVRALSDDVGNTIATDSIKVTIVPSTVTETGTQVAWAAFDDAKGKNKKLNAEQLAKYDDYDVIYVKFTKVMQAGGANGVASTQNYVFRGQPLSTLGTEVQILKGIHGVTNDWDGVTIVVPKGTWNGTNTAAQHGTADVPFNNFSAAFNIAQNFTSVSGERLSGSYEFELTDTNTVNDGVNTAGVGLGAGLEAIYTQNNPGTLGISASPRAAVLSATATEAVAANANGKIDQVSLTLDKPVTIAKDTVVLVNGKKFSSGSTDQVATSTPVFNALNATEEVDGTSTTNLTITTTNGAILVGTGAAVDAAKPVVKSAAIADGKLKVTFSEPIKTSGSIAFDAYLQAQVAAGTAIATPGLGSAIEVGTDYLVFSTASASPTFTSTAVTLDVLAAGPGSALTDATGNLLQAIQAATATNDVKISGLAGSTTPGVVVSGVTATSVSPVRVGVAGVTGTAASVPALAGVTFGGLTSNALSGYTIEFKDNGAAVGAGAATATAALDEVNKKLVVTGSFAATLKPSDANIEAALRGLKAGFDALGKTTQGTEINAITATGTVTGVGTSSITGGTATVTPVQTISSFKIASGATRTAALTVTITETIPAVAPATTATVNKYTITVPATTILAGMTAEQVAAAIAGVAITPVAPASAAGFTVTVEAAGDVTAPASPDLTKLLIKQTATGNGATYSVTVQ